MARRTGSSAISAKTDTHIAQSDFVAGETKRVSLPRDLAPPIRKRVKQILDQNPYLGEPQLPGVIRLAEMEALRKDAQEILEKEGLVTEDRFGVDKAHPSFAILAQLQSGILRQEQSLAITIPTRKEHVAKSEEKMPRGGRSPENRKRGSGAPKLHLA